MLTLIIKTFGVLSGLLNMRNGKWDGSVSKDSAVNASKVLRPSQIT